MSKLQTHLGKGLTGIGQLLGQTLDLPDRSEETKLLADVAKLIAAGFNSLNTHRRFLLSSKLSPSAKKVAQDCPADTLLFGNTSQEKCRAAKEVEKTSKEIKVPERNQASTSLNSRRPTFERNIRPGSSTSETIPEIVEVRCIAGRLKHFVPQWTKITNSWFILNTVKGFKIPFISKPSRKKIKIHRLLSLDENSKMKTVIDDLKEKGVVSICKKEKGEFLSPYFLRRKPNGNARFILNLKHLNEFIKPPHFKLEDYRMAQQLVFKNCFMASLDLRDAYFLIPISKSHRKFLRFQFNSVRYEFSCLCFGLNIAPYIFTKILKPVIMQLRLQGILTVIYLDDILVIGRTFDECRKNINTSIQLLQSLGFIINFEKSQIIPSYECKYLGFNFNSLDMSLSLPEDKINKTLKLLLRIRNKSHCRIREFAQLIGTLISNCPAVPYGYLLVHSKEFERHKYLALRREGGNYNRTMALPNSLNFHINWWITTLRHNPKMYFKQTSFSIEIFTDASPTGW